MSKRGREDMGRLPSQYSAAMLRVLNMWPVPFKVRSFAGSVWAWCEQGSVDMVAAAELGRGGGKAAEFWDEE